MAPIQMLVDGWFVIGDVPPGIAASKRERSKQVEDCCELEPETFIDNEGESETLMRTNTVFFSEDMRSIESRRERELIRCLKCALLTKYTTPKRESGRPRRSLDQSCAMAAAGCRSPPPTNSFLRITSFLSSHFLFLFCFFYFL